MGCIDLPFADDVALAGQGLTVAQGVDVVREVEREEALARANVGLHLGAQRGTGGGIAVAVVLAPRVATMMTRMLTRVWWFSFIGVILFRIHLIEGSRGNGLVSCRSDP